MQDDLKLYDLLTEYWQANRFANSWIIESNDLEQSLANIEQFTKNILAISHNFSIHNYPDCRVVAVDEKHKFISVDQIKRLQEFLYGSAVAGEYKIAVIYGAELMNNNAANSCLKILEDTPKNSYIFMLIPHGSSMIATIESRCFKVNIHHRVEKDQEAGGTVTFYSNRMEFLNAFSDKLDKPKLIQITENYLAKLRNELILESAENGIILQHNILQKIDRIQLLLNDFIHYDLDAKATLILISDAIYGSADRK